MIQEPDDRINAIIARKFTEQIMKGERFFSLDLTKEIVTELTDEGLGEAALIGYINKIVIDLMKDFEEKTEVKS